MRAPSPQNPNPPTLNSNLLVGEFQVQAKGRGPALPLRPMEGGLQKYLILPFSRGDTWQWLGQRGWEVGWVGTEACYLGWWGVRHVAASGARARDIRMAVAMAWVEFLQVLEE